MRKLLAAYCFLILCIVAFTLPILAQTTVFSESFDYSTSAWVSSGTIGTSDFSITRLGDDWGGRVNNNLLELSNDISGIANVNGWTFAYNASAFSSPYTSVLSSNPGLVTWSFNLRQIRTNPAGFSAGNYGVAVILAGSSTTAFDQGTGYAVILGQSYDVDPVRLARYSAGLSTGLTDIITSNTTGLTDFGNEYLSVMVTYDPAAEEWELYLRNDGSTVFTDPLSGSLVSQGTAIDNTYTGSSLEYTGAYWQGSTSAEQTAFFDNFNVVVSSGGGVIEPTTQPTNLVFSSITSSSFDISFTAANPAADGYLAVRKAGSAPTTNPSDGISYGVGTVLGDGIIAYKGSAISFSQTSLTPSTAYYYKIYSYNGSGSLTDYLITNPLSGNQSTTASDPFNGYYNSVAGLSGNALKDGLHTLIENTHTTQFSYTSTTDQLRYTDEDSTNTDNVIEFYTGWSIPKTAYGIDPTDWDKEHVWSKSHGDFGETAPAGTDLHNLRPCDSTVNSQKSNRDFDECTIPYTDDSPYNGYSGVTGCFYNTDAWEPREQDKGDVARIIFYMDTRYEGDDTSFDLEMVDYIDSSPNGEPFYGKFSTLIAWHNADPPDAWEMRRNNRIQERQGNRNPFIDHPEYVASIWGGIEPPSITTATITSITYNSATGGGEVVSAGSYPVTARGICWNTSGLPTLSDSHTSNGTGTGSFVSYMTGLTPGQEYFVRAYATNSVGTSYGNQVVFSTLKAEPASHVTNFTAGSPSSTAIPLSWTDAIADGYVIKGSSVSYAAITAPVDGVVESEGTLVKNITQGTELYTFTSLNPETTYYFKIYPYTNSGININYKTDGTVPQASATTTAVSGYATDLFISEYIEGSSYNKALEIFNGTGLTVNLQNYRIANYYNGGTTPNTLALDNVDLLNGDVYTIVNNQAVTELQALGDLVTGNFAISFNGNDAVVLEKTSNGTDWTYVDIFGKIGDDPGTAWTGDGGYTTLNVTLVRKPFVTEGISVNPTGTGPTAFSTLTTEWDLYPSDTFSYLGSHTFLPPGPPAAPSNLVISVSGNDVILNWGNDATVTNWTVWSSDNPYSGYTLRATVTSNSCTLSGEAPLYNKKFYYVIANN